jgi:hypothetical protein
MMYLLDFLVLRVMILYHIMIPLSPLSLLIVAPYKNKFQHDMHDTIIVLVLPTVIFVQILLLVSP